jgi:hypothetical protein
MEAKNIIKLSVFFALFVGLAPVSIRAAAPGAIADLQCNYSGTPGNIQLSWTAPAGNPTGYELRYDLAEITAGNFNNATPYNYAWSGSAKSVLATGFAQNRNWFFAIKAVNGDGVSAVSNTVSCQANIMAGVNAATYPSSSVSNLTFGSEVPAGKDFLVKGASSDQGGSSVQKVEISFDNGLTWQKTLAVKAAGTGFEWQYNWIAPKAGEYSIKTRATDWLGAQENSSSSLSVKVAAEQGGGQAAATTTVQTATTTATTSQSTSTASQDEQQKRNFLIQIIQILLQILSRR